MNLLALVAATDDGGFHGPSIDEFFPPAIFLAGTPFEINRIILIRFLVVIAIVLIFWLGTRRMKVVPGRFQSVVEMGLDFARVNIAEDLLGKKDGRRFLPLITTILILVFSFNITGVIPFLNISGNATIGMPLVLAIVAWIAFIYAGLRKHPGAFFKNALFPPGVPWPLYIIVTPIELVSTFILRPITLTLRLLMNMIVGHLLLVLFFSATSFFLFTATQTSIFYGLFGVGTIAFGFVFTLFEILVAVLQAYVFALLTTVYIQLALADEH
ncbi:F0F1 ATP synthase subunit A [Herbiconiux sp. 11R-BC]|uniref:F0F1 ATP synthase subunit A n=1 Tax=Herbiconiux sp. 11R-BC TaxID=3111637 RepID=UPI0010F9B0D8